MIKKPHQNGTQEKTPFCPGKSRGKARRVKYTISGRITTFAATKYTASSIFSFHVQRRSYKPKKNSTTPSASVNTGNPQVLKFVKNTPRKVNTGFAGPCSQGWAPVIQHVASNKTSGKRYSPTLASPFRQIDRAIAGLIGTRVGPTGQARRPHPDRGHETPIQLRKVVVGCAPNKDANNLLVY